MMAFLLGLFNQQLTHNLPALGIVVGVPFDEVYRIRVVYGVEQPI